MPAAQHRATARASLRGHWGLSIIVTLVAAILGGSVSTVSNNIVSSSSGSAGGSAVGNYGSSYFGGMLSAFVLGVIATAAFFVFLYSLVVFLFGGAVNLGLRKYNIDLVGRAQAPAFSTLFSRFAYFGKALLLQLVSAIFIFLWMLLFVFPGIIAAYRYSMAPYLMAQNPNIGVMEALRQSKQLMRGNKFKLFCLHLSFIGWFLLCALTLGIGLLWLNPYRCASEASFYLYISGQQRYEYAGGPPPNDTI